MGLFRNWASGLIPLGALFAVSAGWMQAGVETDLKARGGALLASSGLEWAQVEMNGRDARLVGEAPSPDSKALAVAAADRVFGIREVKDGMTVVPEAKPFTLTALRDGAKVTLTGFVPPGNARKEIVAAAGKTFPGAAIVDEMKVARGAAANFQPVVSYGLGELGKLSEGTLSVTDATLSLTGRAADFGKFVDVRTKLASLPAGAKLGKGLGAGDILPPIVKPFTLQAEKTAGGINLSGYVPSDEIKSRLIGEARATGLPVREQLQVADGATAGFPALASFGLGELGKLSSGQLAISDSTLSLTGRAADFAKFGDVRTRLASLPAGATLAKGLGGGDILPPVMKPFTFAAEKNAAGITLTGYVPSEEARARLLAEARSSGLSVRDLMQVADGASTGDWAGTAIGLLREFDKLETAKATLTDTKATLIGKAKGLLGEADVRADLRNLPAGFALTQVAIEPGAIKPYTFNADRGENSVMLSGYVPDAKTRADIVDIAKRYFEGNTVEDKLVEGPGAPKDFTVAVRAGLQELARLGAGAKLAVSDAGIALTGLAKFDAAREQIGIAFRAALPASFKPTLEIGTAPLPPAIEELPVCEAEYRKVLERGKVYFKVASAELSDQSRAVLDELAVITMRCRGGKIEIAGHTDGDGQASANLDLSRRRAQSVAAYFEAAGIPTDRLNPTGYGSSVPVAPNDTAENKAKNRRIEFLVK